MNAEIRTKIDMPVECFFFVLWVIWYVQTAFELRSPIEIEIDFVPTLKVEKLYINYNLHHYILYISFHFYLN